MKHTNSAGPHRGGADRLHNVPVQDPAETRPRGPRAVAALVVPVLCVAMVPIASWLDMGAPTSGPGYDVAGGPGWPWTLIGALLGVLASVILVREPRQRVGWVLACSGLFWALDGLSQSYFLSGLRETGAWPGMTFAL